MAVLGLYALVGFAAFSFLCLIVGERPIVDAIGVIANLIEATVSLPIFIRIVLRQQLTDLSVILIFQDICADVTKMGLFVITKVPFCFIFGASYQLTVDTTTILTYLRLRKKEAKVFEMEEDQ
jgi:hypothetical protein